MKSIDENSWNNFYKKYTNGGPWDNPLGSPDQHVVDFIEKNGIKSGRILDVGMADGRNSKYLIECGLDVTGIDISEEVVNRTQKKLPTGNFIIRDAVDLGFYNEYDYIVDAGALHVNHPNSHHSIIDNYYAALKHNGLLFIRIFHSDKTQKIFDVHKAYNMPVYGMSLEEARLLYKDYFEEIYFYHDLEYGAHGGGCMYIHLRKI